MDNYELLFVAYKKALQLHKFSSWAQAELRRGLYAEGQVLHLAESLGIGGTRAEILAEVFRLRDAWRASKVSGRRSQST